MMSLSVLFLVSLLFLMRFQLLLERDDRNDVFFPARIPFCAELKRLFIFTSK